VSSLTPLLAAHRLFTTADADRCLKRTGGLSRRGRDRLLAELCATGALVRVRRGLYASIAADGATPDAFHLVSRLAPDAIVGVHSALEARGLIPPSQRRCVYFTRLASAGSGPVWQGVTMHPASHPTALVRNGGPFIETELLDGNGCGPLRVATVERAFVDMLERPRLTGAWCDVVQVIGLIRLLDLDRVVRYLERLENATTAAKAGWVLERHQEQFGVSTPILSRLERLRPRGPHYLSRTDRQSGRYMGRWNLVVPPQM
jgi:predicted transcriptional regulator of viral defense system